MSEPIRILLGSKASDHLTALGDRCFIVIGRASWPDDPKRWALHLVPCPIKLANDGVAVALGERVARKRPVKKSVPAVPPVPERMADGGPATPASK